MEKKQNKNSKIDNTSRGEPTMKKKQPEKPNQCTELVGLNANSEHTLTHIDLTVAQL
jgi:hypothetical protein